MDADSNSIGSYFSDSCSNQLVFQACCWFAGQTALVDASEQNFQLAVAADMVVVAGQEQAVAELVVANKQIVVERQQGGDFAVGRICFVVVRLILIQGQIDSVRFVGPVQCGFVGFVDEKS